MQVPTDCLLETLHLPCHLHSHVPLLLQSDVPLLLQSDVSPVCWLLGLLPASSESVVPPVTGGTCGEFAELSPGHKGTGGELRQVVSGLQRYWRGITPSCLRATKVLAGNYAKLSSTYKGTGGELRRVVFDLQRYWRRITPSCLRATKVLEELSPAPKGTDREERQSVSGMKRLLGRGWW